MRRVLSIGVLFAVCFLGACKSTVESTSSQKKIASNQPITVSSKNIFTLQKGGIQCFHEFESNTKIDIVCHTNIIQDDETQTLADFIPQSVKIEWQAPVVASTIQVQQLSCDVLGKGLSFRCHLLTSQPLSETEENLLVSFSIKAQEKEALVEKTASVNLANNSEIPIDFQLRILDEDPNAEDPTPINPGELTPLIGRTSRGAVSIQPSNPSPSKSLQPMISWFDNDETKPKLLCKQRADAVVKDENSYQVKIDCALQMSIEFQSRFERAAFDLKTISEGSQPVACKLIAAPARFECEAVVLRSSPFETSNRTSIRVEASIKGSNQSYDLVTISTPLTL